MIVIDVGCAKHGGDESIPYLVEEFKPSVLFGFDPAAVEDTYALGGTRVVVEQAAAWTYDGTVGFTVEGLRGHVSNVGQQFPCVDLARVIAAVAEDDSDVVLKLDAEGAEYVLLPFLRDRGVDRLLKLAWVEWHCPECGTGWFADDDTCGRCAAHVPGSRSMLEASMNCDMHQWNR